MKDEDEKNQEESKRLELLLNHSGFGLFHVLLVLISGMGFGMAIVGLYAVSLVTPIADSELSMDSTDKGSVFAVHIAGKLIGGLVGGALSDTMGRKRCLFAILVLISASLLVLTFSVNFPFFLVFTLTAGVGAGGSLPIGLTYVSEFFTEKRRGPVLVIWSLFWDIGMLCTILLAWLLMGSATTDDAVTSSKLHIGSLHVSDWRLFLLLCSIPGFLSAILILFIPETPAYLYHQKKFKTLENALKKIDRMNKLFPCCWCHNTRKEEESYPLLSELELDSQQKQHKTKKCCLSCKEISKQVVLRILQSYSWTYLQGTLLLHVLFFTLGFGYFTIEMWFPEYFKYLRRETMTSNSTINDRTFYQDTLVAVVGNIPAAVITALIINILGARILLVSYAFLSSLSVYILWRAVVNSQVVIFLGFGTVYSMSIVTAYKTVQVCAANIYHTNLRATALGLHIGIFSRLGPIAGNVIYGELIDVDKGLPILLTASLLTLSGIAALILPKIYHHPENNPLLHKAILKLWEKCTSKKKALRSK